jgi:alpha-glucosidase (family GH31 glycosyl hydrolase)
MKLVPYLKLLTREANETGTPVVRPLFLAYPEQEDAWEDWQTYLLGDDVLISAIWQSGKEKHRLYLPAGQEWIDAWDTGKIYQGGKYIEVDAPKYKIPVFIRKGSKINLGDLNALYQESLEIASQRPDLTKLEKEEGWGDN